MVDPRKPDRSAESAAEVERLVADAVRRELAIEQEVTERELVEGYVARIEVQEAKILIELSEAGIDARTLRIPWQKRPFKRHRELLAPASANPQDPRPIRADARARVVAALSRGRRWLDEIVSGSAKSIEESPMPWEKDVSITPLAEPGKAAYLGECVADGLAKGSEIVDKGGAASCK